MDRSDLSDLNHVLVRARFCRVSQAGQNMNELAVILGLVVLVGLGAFYTLGPEIKRLFTDSKDELNQGAVASHQGPQSEGTGVNGASNPGGTGAMSQTPEGSVGGDDADSSGSTLNKYQHLPQYRFKISLDPYTQMANIVADTSISSGTNTTSELGEQDSFIAQVSTGQPNSVAKTLRLASALNGMARAEGDVKAREYYQKLAQVSYYLGGVQGELDDVKGLDISPRSPHQAGLPNPKDYTNADALRDLIAYSAELRLLIQSPPTGVDPQKRAVAVALGREIFQLAQKYQFAHKRFLDEKGFATGENWANDETCEETETCELNGYPGKSLKSTKNTNYGKKVQAQGWQYDQLISFEDLVKTSETILAQSAQPGDGIQLVLFKMAALTQQASAAP